jgi:hypothetical protein
MKVDSRVRITYHWSAFVRPLLHWKSVSIHILSVCCNLRCPASNAVAPYHQWPVRLYDIFLHYIISDTIFEKKKLLNINRILIFSTTFVWNISHSKKNWARYDQKCALFFMYSTRYSCPILTKVEFTWQIFEKSSNVNFHENSSSGIRVPCKQTDWPDEATRRFSQLKIHVIFAQFMNKRFVTMQCCLQKTRIPFVFATLRL